MFIIKIKTDIFRNTINQRYFKAFDLIINLKVVVKWKILDGKSADPW